MPRDEEKHRHRKRNASSDEKDRDQPKSNRTDRGSRHKDESSSRHRRKHSRYASDEEEEGKHKRDRKKSGRGDEMDDESSSSNPVSRGEPRKDRHRHDRKRDEKIDRKKSGRKSDDPKKKKKTKRKHSRRDDSSDDDEHARKKSSKRATTSKRVDKSTLYPMGDPVGSAPATLIDPETDYFTYHQEFWVYLFREEGVRFNDMQSDEARAAFARFAKMYNTGKLEAPYYDNPPLFPPQVLEESKTTRHEWGFQTTATERKGLEQLQEGVRRLTQYREGDESQGDRAIQSTSINNNDMARKLDQGPSERRHKTPEEQLEEHRANRRLKDSIRTAQEEVTGGAKDFRERQMEKKREQADRMHGAARDKEESGAGVELSDAAVYGDGDRSFKQALAQERQSKAKREAMRNARVEELKQKEQERQSNMLKMLGLDAVQPGHKIQIAPRKDG